MKKSLVYFQSGGPTAIINTSMYGVIKEAKRQTEYIDGIYGSLHGIEGLLNDNLIDLRQEDEAQIELLKQTPAAALGTTRYKLSGDINHEDYQKILNNVKKHNIGYMLVNGGNDSMDTCYKLSTFFRKMDFDCKVIGIPKTIDNDLAFTDHCLGYPSAARYVVQSIQDIALDNKVYPKSKFVIVEVMGRHAGWLTAAASVIQDPELKPDYIYLPEEKFDLEEFLARAKEVYERKKRALFVVSEGIETQMPNLDKSVDAFGHAQLGGFAAKLAGIVEERLGYSTRPIEFSLLQRAGTLAITETDQKEAIKVSTVAVKRIVAGKTGQMVIIDRKPGPKYKVSYKLKNLRGIANVEHKMTPELIHDVNNGGKLFGEYLFPLIDKPIKLQLENGVAKYTKLKKVKVK
ncbi:MAG: Pyrophosphate--fructose 6-phosphate 1-phosphotransferase [Tenericutes bacterium ADurb.Bin024]|jgi:6-phosphofructokinase 1|nr:MAG: Pyrophosphate--fructose 6-phosphate 1-phosphotransferase [Tenericutes bacterium ADurb.Bin024]HOA10857.1 6-phosphofructokinase [Bacilli bacterium]HOM32284.1 6-phosphofructokinase [Bacilli bacterium]